MDSKIIETAFNIHILPHLLPFWQTVHLSFYWVQLV